MSAPTTFNNPLKPNTKIDMEFEIKISARESCDQISTTVYSLFNLSVEA